MAQVRLEGIAKSFAKTVALHPTDLDVEDGEFLTLLGPSGCGKTTTLRIVAGFVTPSAGSVWIDGVDAVRLPPQRRGIGMVFQDYALFPHLTIAENIGFGLRERGVPAARIRARVGELLELIRLPDIGKRLPGEISGGQQQRVAFARAIAHLPKVLLMDEPLGALDLKLREALQIELRQLQRQLGITTLYVTHDQGEAMNLSDRIAVMEKGRIVQLGSARAIYERPATRFVAEFVGKINMIEGQVVGGSAGAVVLRAGDAMFRAAAGEPVEAGAARLAVRPQHVAIVNGGGIPAGNNTLAGRVVAQSFSGNLIHIQVQTERDLWTVEARPGEHPVAEGADVTLTWRPDESLVLRD